MPAKKKAGGSGKPAPPSKKCRQGGDEAGAGADVCGLVCAGADVRIEAGADAVGDADDGAGADV